MPDYHGWTHRPKEEGGTDPIPIPRGTSLPYAHAQTGLVSVTDTPSDHHYVDFMTGTIFETNSSLLSLVNDSPNTPASGILVPKDYLAEVLVWVTLDSLVADGAHYIEWIISTGHGFDRFGPAPTALSPASAFSATGLADDLSAPDSLVLTAKLGSNSGPFPVGVRHSWFNYTTGPRSFRYGMSVELIGDLPV